MLQLGLPMGMTGVLPPCHQGARVQTSAMPLHNLPQSQGTLGEITSQAQNVGRMDSFEINKMRPRPTPLRTGSMPSPGYPKPRHHHHHQVPRQVDLRPLPGSPEYPQYLHRVQQRLKQLKLGKATVGYSNYVRLVHPEARDPTDPLHVFTPRAELNCSKRHWDSQVRNWRRALHKFDDATTEEPHQFDDAATDAVRTVRSSDAQSLLSAVDTTVDSASPGDLATPQCAVPSPEAPPTSENSFALPPAEEWAPAVAPQQHQDWYNREWHSRHAAPPGGAGALPPPPPPPPLGGLRAKYDTTTVATTTTTGSWADEEDEMDWDNINTTPEAIAAPDVMPEQTNIANMDLEEAHAWYS